MDPQPLVLKLRKGPPELNFDKEKPVRQGAWQKINSYTGAIFQGANLGLAGAPLGLIVTLVAFNADILQKIARQMGTLLEYHNKVGNLAERIGVASVHRFLNARMVDAIDLTFQESIFGINALDLGMSVVGNPLLDEIQYRYLLQDVLLTQIPKFVIRQFAPGKESLLDSKIAKATRILFTTTLFSFHQIHHISYQSPFIVSAFLVYAFTAGLALGTIKESKAGLLGSSTAYITHNLLRQSIITLFTAQHSF